MQATLKRVYAIDITDTLLHNPETKSYCRHLCMECVGLYSSAKFKNEKRYRVKLMNLVPRLKCENCGYVDPLLKERQEN